MSPVLQYPNLMRRNCVDEARPLLSKKPTTFRDIKERLTGLLVGREYKHEAIIGIWNDLSEKVKAEVAAHVFKLLESKQTNIFKVPSEVIWFHAEKLAAVCPSSGFIKTFRFRYSNGFALDFIFDRLAELLKPDAGDPLDGSEYCKRGCEALNKFPVSYIELCLQRLVREAKNSREAEDNARSTIDTVKRVVMHENNKGLFPNIKAMFDRRATADFDMALDAKDVKLFKVRLAAIKGTGKEIEQLQILINRLVGLIGTSRFQGKYEDMMELCLVRLMELSDPKEGLNLDPELLKKCLGILNNYFFKSNIKKFLMTPDTTVRGEHVPKELPLFYFIRRRMENKPNILVTYPKIADLTVVDTEAFDFKNLPESVRDFEHVIKSSLVRFSVQGLFQQYLGNKPSSPVVEHLIKYYGADINAMQDGESLLLGLIRECGRLEKEGQGQAADAHYQAILILIEKEGLKVTQADVAAAKNIPNGKGLPLSKALYDKNPEQLVSPYVLTLESVRQEGRESVDEKGKEEAEVPVARAAVAIEPACVAPVPAALLGEIVGREDAHPVHARRNSDGAPAAAELKSSPTLGAKQ